MNHLSNKFKNNIKFESKTELTRKKDLKRWQMSLKLPKSVSDFIEDTWKPLYESQFGNIQDVLREFTYFVKNNSNPKNIDKLINVLQLIGYKEAISDDQPK